MGASALPFIDGMSWIDFVLNIAGVLLWLNWCSLRLDPTRRARPSTLAGTLKPATPDPYKQWRLLGGLGLLIMTKAIVYWLLNSPAEWPPRLDLGVILLVFRVGDFPLALLFSVAGFLRMLLIAYTWLLVLLTLGRGAVEPDPIQRIIALQFGRLARWPAWVLLLLPVAGVLLFWVAGHPLLLLAEAVAPASSWGALLGQGLIVSLAMFLTLKYLIPVILLLHLLSSYVYMGNHPIWDFVSTISRTVLKPLQRFPLRSARMDFGPLAGILLVLLLLHALPTWLISMAQARNLPLWPQ